ncbi:amidohydrolase family protein [Herbiconiux sp. CPCC 203407]|uniref:Amidohydrolase family protein n=1 Tax=Herbiconiux oxytropis TaxID=2970915 RepID=A0AA41XDW0_9MICO|nr:amidohydrolase family protein [Herbiconiux oxytropis]MCS5720887.1 amidohydrolase family protein [Herbiconiux oxytropis]MCS5724364.1 amidohydrolase family protein [Herbiconiux oxytropis]
MSGPLLLAGARLPGVGTPVDVRIDDGVVTGIGPAGAVAAGPDSERIRLDGRWLVPGLWDNHVHFTQWASSARRLDVSRARSAAETVALVRGATGAHARVAAPAAPALLVGIGFRDGLWSDAPTAEALDVVTGDRPVVLISADLHCCWLNTAALTSFGVTGHPDGVLREEDAFAVHRALDDVPAATSDVWALDAARAAAARGVVGIVDLEMAWNHEVWLRRSATGHDLLRVEFGVYPQHLERAIAEGLRTGDAVTDLVMVGPFKVITDGSLNTRTAFCFDEYPGLEGRPESRGVLAVEPRELEPLLARASAAGFAVAVHAIGDHANRLALDAFAATGSTGSIEHAQLLAPEEFSRFAALGAVASVQPEHALDDRDVADRFWAGRTGRAFALAALLDAGARIALGSDAPVAPLDPWVTMAAAVGRERDGRAPWHPEQRIPAAAALAASARGREGIAVGDVADLVALDRDPLAASPDELRTMPVALTLLAGRPTHASL